MSNIEVAIEILVYISDRMLGYRERSDGIGMSMD
jgi:hypothetical protein